METIYIFENFVVQMVTPIDLWYFFKLIDFLYYLY